MKKIIVAIFVVLVIILVRGFWISNSPKEIETVAEINNNVDIVKEEEEFKPVPAIVIKEFVTKQGKPLKRGNRVTIIEIEEDGYLVEFNGKKEIVEKENIGYFKFNKEEKYSLAIDVSEFNIDAKGITKTASCFKDNIDFAEFIINNNINYAYIRIGGRGWGQKGTLYNDDNAKLYIDICEYLKIPYGFYYIEEA